MIEIEQSDRGGMLVAARAYIRRGFSVIPLEPQGKRPEIPWKQFQSRQPSDEELLEWFAKDRRNLGIVTGEISRITVLDIDSEDAMKLAAGRGLPPTPRVRTGKGWHLYFAYEPGLGNFQRRDDLPGIDLRGDGGYVVAPPSVHKSGALYTWYDESLAFAPLSAWVPRRAENRQAPGQARDVHDTIHGVESGRRDQSLFQYASSLRACGLSQAEAKVLVLTAAAQCSPQFPASLALDKIQRAYGYAPKRRPTTDLGNAERIVDLYGGELRYVPGIGWLVWDERRWSHDNANRVFDYAATSTRLIVAEVPGEEDDGVRRDVRRWGKSSESRARLSAAVDLAAKQPALVALPSEFDRNPFLLNVQNGILDLRAQELRPHKSASLHSKLANATFDATASCPIFIALLDRVIGDESTIRFLQCWFGYCLTGDNAAQKIVIFSGPGANGKSTILNAIRWVLGDYAAHIDGSTLTSAPVGGGQPRSDLARLMSTRFVTAAELEPMAVLNESLIKQLSGGDPITCRAPYEKADVQFTPIFKLVIATNEWPRIRGTDEGIWRRLLLVPFSVCIPEHDQDRELEHRIRREASGILNWMVEGLRDFERGGLPVSERVAQASIRWREATDPIGTFIRDFLSASRRKTPSLAIKAAYTTFCKANGHALEETRLWAAMRCRGFEPYRTGKGRGWHVELRVPGDSGDASNRLSLEDQEI